MMSGLSVLGQIAPDAFGASVTPRSEMLSKRTSLPLG